MFEKEAEERAERKISNFIPQQWGVILIRTEQTYETVEGAPHFYLRSLAKMWKEGAEFGYNKANEWHYVKDGNPDNENDILCQIAKDEVVVGYYHTVEKRYITIEGQDLYNVIAWKEIVLPELKESE